MHVLTDDGLDTENIFPEKRFGFGLGFSVMGRVKFGSHVLPHEGLNIYNLNLRGVFEVVLENSGGS